MTFGSHPAFVILAAAVAAPLLAELPVVRRVPIVVLEVLLGIVVGPQLLGLVRPDAFLSIMSTLGIAALLFMAGTEIDFAAIRGRPLSLAVQGWVISAAIVFVAIGGLHLVPGVHAPLMATIALTTTGLGTLLPILRDGARLETPFGRMVLAAGTLGEVGPIVAVSLALSTRYSTWQEFAFLLAFLGLVALAAAVGVGVRPPRLLSFLGRTMHASSQLPVRFALLMLAVLFTLSEEFGFEGILGAFAAGMVVGLATRGKDGEQFRVKIDAVCFGWFTPFFFVGTGVAFDLGALTRDIATMVLIPAFLILFLVARGIPVVLYRNEIPGPERLPFTLFTSVASLGLIVIITRIGSQAYAMNPDIAQALIAAALLSSLVFPTFAGALLPKVSTPAPRPDSGRVNVSIAEQEGP
jgi:Kef-type K+ transport system membrane component KefB